MTWQIIAEIIIAILALIGTGLGAYFANRKSTALMEYRLQRLEEEVRKHNNIIERTYALESDMEVVKEDIKHLEKEKSK